MVKNEGRCTGFRKRVRKPGHGESAGHPGESVLDGKASFQNPQDAALGKQLEPAPESHQEKKAGPMPDDSCWDVFLPDDEFPAEEDLLADGKWDWDERDRDADAESDPWGR